MNVIRCDEEQYLVWKWRPGGQDVNTTSRENSIRWGSSLRVKDGEVAVFVYKQQDGTSQDFILGPFDETIKTANFPVLASIVGMFYGGTNAQLANLRKNVPNSQITHGVKNYCAFAPSFDAPVSLLKGSKPAESLELNTQRDGRYQFKQI